MKQLMIIDGSSLLYRAFFALPPLKSALGVPTNAVYGFLTMLIKLYEEIHPDYIVVAFDKGKVTFRTELYTDYKGNRPEAPDDLRPQFALIREVLEAMGIRVIEQEGFEGDDIIGSLSKIFATPELGVKIITGDRDTLQLVSEHADVMLTKKGISDMLEVTMSTMESLYGYGPDKVIEMKALMGDSSDNIPGVPGVGEKTALKLITAHQTLEGVYDHIDEISGKKLKEKLIDNKELAFLSKQLATIKTDMALDVTLEDFTTNFHLSEVTPLFNSLGFHNLIPRLVKVMAPNEVSGDEDSLFFDNTLVPDIQSLESSSLTAEYYTEKDIAIYVRTDGIAPFEKAVTVYLYNGEDVITVHGDDGAGIQQVVAALHKANRIITIQSKQLLEIFDTDMIDKIPLFNETGKEHVLDVALMAYLLDPTRTNYGMLYLCERFKAPMIHASGNEQEFISMVTSLYAMVSTAQEEMIARKLWDLYMTIELPLVRTLAIMEKNGIYIDPIALDETRLKFTAELDVLKDDIYKEAGETFNINSPKQLGIILFEKLGLPVIKKTKTGYSTDAEVLEMLRHESPIIEKIVAYRIVAKLVSTYLEGLAVLINKNTHRIHTHFNQMVTATGRLSSSEPNLQNIPVRTEKGKEIRTLFLPGEGYDILVSADYSQIELRILAHLSGDEALIQAFKNGADIHRFTAAEVLGKKPEDVTSLERSHAKAVNFGIIYGISDFGLSRDLGITRQEAKKYIDLYYQRYPNIKKYMNSVIQQAHETGEVRTMFGRLRQLDDINSKNFNRRSFAERTAMNTPIQGTAADIIKIAMNRVEQELEKGKFASRLLLQVHDELVLEVKQSEEQAIVELLRSVMEHVVSLQVPLIVDIHSARNWALVK